MLGFLKGIGKVAGGLIGLGGGGIDYTKLRDALGAAGAGVGGAANAAANNRGSQFDGQMALERLLMERDGQYFDQSLAREREGRDSQNNAWKQLMAAQRMSQPSTRPMLSPYSTPRRETSQAGNEGAALLMAEAMARLRGGNPIAMPERRTPAVDPNLLRAGTGEKVGGWLAPILTTIGGINRRPTPQEGMR